VISIDTFFTELCGEDRNLFGDAIFDLIDTEDTETLEFGEFVMGVCTFALFQVKDVLRFSFFIFDKDKNGYIDKDELELFVTTLHASGMQGNIMNSLHSIDFNGDGKFDFGEFCALHDKFPTVLYPAFRLQQRMCGRIMGDKWWERKKNFLQFRKDAEMERLEKMRRLEEKKTEAMRKRVIRSEMGFVSYLKGGKRREYFLRMNPAAEVYIDAQKTVQIRYPEPKHLPGDDQFRTEEQQREFMMKEGGAADPEKDQNGRVSPSGEQGRVSPTAQ